MTAMAADKRNDLRKRELARIHIYRDELAMDEDHYRDMLFAVARVRSAGDLDWTGRMRVIDHLRRLGAGKPPKAGDDDKQARYIKFLWHRLHALGAVEHDTPRALAAFVKRVAHRDALAWLSTAEARTVIEALKQWVARAEAEQAAD